MLEENTTITLDNDKDYAVLKTLNYNNKEYALISDFKEENHVVLVENEGGGLVVSLLENEKEEELIANMFLKKGLSELKELEASEQEEN